MTEPRWAVGPGLMDAQPSCDDHMSRLPEAVFSLFHGKHGYTTILGALPASQPYAISSSLAHHTAQRRNTSAMGHLAASSLCEWATSSPCLHSLAVASLPMRPGQGTVRVQARRDNQSKIRPPLPRRRNKGGGPATTRELGGQFGTCMLQPAG